MKLSGQKILIYFSVLMVGFLLAFLFRHNILKGVGNLLIHNDSPVEVDALFVLGGDPGERATKAAELYHLGYTTRVIATGQRIPPLLEVLDTVISEAELTREALLQAGVDGSAIGVLIQGTSTYEESDIILGYAEQRNLKRIGIVSSKFHTRRIQRVFQKKFEDAGILPFIFAAEPQRYDTDNWWNNEEAMIFVNNEYMKHLYYLWKYR